MNIEEIKKRRANHELTLEDYDWLIAEFEVYKSAVFIACLRDSGCNKTADSVSEHALGYIAEARRRIAERSSK